VQSLDLTNHQIDLMLHFILSQSEQSLISHFERVDPSDRTRAFRRFALLIHPDKCQSLRAKEAFQLILSCSRWLKNNRGKSIYKTYFIPYLIRLSTAQCTTLAAPASATSSHLSHSRGFFYDIASF